MTVSELIFELQSLPQNLDVSVIDYSKKRFKEHREFCFHVVQPEYNDSYVAMYINVPDNLLL